MPRKPASVPPPQWLDAGQQRAWLAYIRVQLRMSYEMNRQLQADSAMSLPDYDVLTALSVAPGTSLPVTALAAQIGWERSRASHHIKRMSTRGLVSTGLAPADRRVTEVTMTAEGRQAIEAAAVGHVALVRRLFFEGLPIELLEPFSDALEHINEHIQATGTLPRPASTAG
jgi:DNA-binding MarR family transcriptional regulator